VSNIPATTIVKFLMQLKSPKSPLSAVSAQHSAAIYQNDRFTGHALATFASVRRSSGNARTGAAAGTVEAIDHAFLSKNVI